MKSWARLCLAQLVQPKISEEPWPKEEESERSSKLKNAVKPQILGSGDKAMKSYQEIESETYQGEGLEL